MASDQNVEGGRLLKLVQSAAITPEAAEELVAKYRNQLKSSGRPRSDQEMAEAISDKVIKRYSKLAGMTGGASALAGVVPGIGTIVAATGGAVADAAACMKLQVDMSMCMASAYGYDLTSEDARHLSFLIAASGSVEKFGVEASTKLASKAGVKMLRQYLRGAALQAIKELFKKIGITFTRKALEKALPFGIGVIIGGSANYALTKFVGRQAKEWFIIDASME